MMWLLALGLLLAVLTIVAFRRRRACPPPPGAFVDAGGARLHYVTRGSGPPLVFLHGNDATHLDFSLSILGRAAEEYKVIAFDRPGHGYSARPPAAASVVAQMEWIRAAVRELGLEKPILAGHSWSGSLVLAYTLSYPDEIAGIVVVAGAAYASGTGLFPDPRFVTLVPGLGRLAWTAGALFARPFVLKALRRAFAPAEIPAGWLAAVEPFQIWNASHVQAAAEDFLALARDLPRLSARYSGIRTPAVIVTGDRDLSVPPDQHAYRLAREIPHAVLMTVPGAGHMLQFTHPEAVMEAIGRLGKASTAPASS